MIYAFCIAGLVYGESTAHMRIALQVINSAELCCLINAFRIPRGAFTLDKVFLIAGLVCGVSIYF